jgi:hypothetical protein
MNTITDEQKRLKELSSLKIGDKIHIKSRQGIYTFVKKDKWKGLIYITSNKWGYDENPIKTTLYNDFKCLAGGIWNFTKKNKV